MSGDLKVTILGCGSSGGVPRVGGEWGICDPNEPKNRRSRCSILVEYRDKLAAPDARPTTVLIDTSPDLRAQLLKTGTDRLDAILFTHDHADQSHGIDDTRAIAYRMREQIPTYMDAPTRDNVFQRFKYCFEMPEGRVHPPILTLMPLLEPGKSILVEGPGGALPVHVLEVSHGPTPSLGFIFDNKIAYTPDVWEISQDGLEQISVAETWIVDALRYNEHPTHAHADRVMCWIANTRMRQAVLTNLHIDMDYQTLMDELPGQHVAAFDGMEIRI